MIARHNTADYVNTIFRANTPDNLAYTFLYITLQNLKSILRRPHHMITVIENTVLAFVVLHNHTLQKNEPQGPTGRFIFLESMIIHITFALKLARLKTGGLDQRVDTKVGGSNSSVIPKQFLCCIEFGKWKHKSH